MIAEFARRAKAARLAHLGAAGWLLTISVDVRDENAVQQAVERAVARLGRIDGPRGDPTSSGCSVVVPQ
ncbi:hypothetical protein ACWEVP_14180 [Amycolatopsis sp. NPDC003865]